MADRNAAPTVDTGVAQVFELHRIKEFNAEKRVRKKLFKTRQLWSEVACYEPGQGTVMHHHPYEEEAIFVLEGRANMEIAGEEVVVPAGGIIRFSENVEHDIRNLGDERCVIMFWKVPTRLAKMAADSG